MPGAIQKACENEPDLKLRIGIHQGEVVFEGDDVFGDGVNIVSRLEPLAPIGGILVSDSVNRNLGNKKGIESSFVKEEILKNVKDPVRIYQVKVEGIESPISAPAQPADEKPKAGNRKGVMIGGGIIILVLLALVFNQYQPSESSTPAQTGAELVTEIDKSIAVLPFIDLSPNKDQEYFCVGMMDEILMHLYKIGDLRVTSRTSAMGFKGTDKKVKEIAHELGVAHILEGSVRKSGDRIRINLQLIDSSDQHLWAESYDRDLLDVFAIQSEVAQQVSSALKAEISPEVKERIENLPTENLEAYDYYLKGNETYRSSWDSMDLNKIYESMEFYQKAIELDQDFSLAYTGMGRSYWWLAHFEVGSIRPELWKKSKKYLNKAISLDPNNGWAYGEMGVVLSNWDWDSTATRTSLDKAIELMPNDRNAYRHYCWHEYRLGNCKKLRWIIEARKRFDPRVGDPFSQWNLQWLNCQNRYSEIVSISDEYWDSGFSPNQAWPMFNAYLHENEFEKANKLVNYTKENVKVRSWYLNQKAMLTAKQGNRSTTNQLMDSLEMLSRVEFVANTWYAAIFAALGEKEQMYEYLNIALEKREKELHDIHEYSVFDPYRSEPRFKEVVRKMWIPLEEN